MKLSYLNSNINESRVFKLPQHILNIIEPLKTLLRKTTLKYQNHNDRINNEIILGRIQDPFNENNEIKIIAALRGSNFYDKIGHGALITYTNGQADIYYKIPFTNDETVKHELIHAYDPKVRKLNKNSNQGEFQDNKTPHEIDAHIGGFIDRILNLSTEEKEIQLKEIKNWLKHPNFNIEPYENHLLYYISCFKNRPKELKRLMTIVYNELFN